ncbi:MAG: DUF4835 family protein [Candidatus Electryonea clarkiae]|nr:DUF4835 family protein [Candidatus Electryonea clarkiae]MDP8285160.1 DUF4835 family protein [Candidatus Electryonea clarkiae]
MNKLNTFTICFLILISLAVNESHAQRIIAEVSVNLERLPQENQNKLQGLDRIVEAYINQEDWAPDEYGYDVFLDIEIFFEEFKPISFEERYAARIVISNRSNAQFNDKRWDFPLEPGVQLKYNQQFDPFRSMIDYYLHMVLGYEFDKVKKFGGSIYFETARQIAQNARFSSRYFNGWDKREELIDEVMVEENNQFRYMNFLYYTGEWLYYDERDRETARQYLLYAIKQLDRVPQRKLERFFSLNYHNFANALADYKEYSSLSKLASMDPEHTDLYQKLLKKQ